MPNERPRATKKTIGEFGRDIDELKGSTRQLGSSLSAFLQALSSFLDGSAVAIYLYDDQDDEFVLRGSTQPLRGTGEAQRFGAGSTVPGLALAEHRSVSLAENPGVKGGKLRAEEHVFPLQAGGRALGAVTITHIAAERLSPVRLDAARRGVLRFAEVLDKARSEEGSARRMSRLSAINEFGVILVSSLAPEEVPALATAMTSFIMGTEGCILRLRDEKTAESSVRDAHGLRDETSSREILELEKLASQQVLSTGKTLLVRDVAANERFRNWGARVKTFLCFPLAGGSGTITLFNKDPESPLTPARFSQEDQDVLLHLVRYIEKAIGNAALFEKNRKLVERDELTGLPDRANFQTRLLTEISRARRFHLRIALVTCEVQPPPAREDTPDGEATKQTMQRVAQAIRSAVRDYDTVARIAERTFGIILPQVQNGTGSPITRIQAALDGEPDLKVNFSHMTFPDDGIDGEQMITRLERQR
ncbi:MAG: diguanylate cyclase domain-containing protein [Candidatus Methylomirabilia bacterium]